MSPSRLEEIVAQRRRKLPQLLEEARGEPLPSEPPLSLGQAIAAGTAVIAEIKRRSPSAGMLNGALDAAAQGRKYVSGGANAISVLTESDFFGGSPQDLRSVRATVSLPILCKDFLIDPRQVALARKWGADAVLVIVRIATGNLLHELLHAAQQIGVEVLCEVHDEAELERALEAGASIIGVNNRDLTTFETDLARGLRLLPRIPADRLAVAESGIRTVADAVQCFAAGAAAVLIGEALVTSPDPARFLLALRQGKEGVGG